MKSFDKQISETMREILNEEIFQVPKIVESFYRHTTAEDRAALCVDYRDIMWSTPPDFENPLTLTMSPILNEGLVRTYPIEKTVEYVRSYLHLHPYQVNIETTKTGAQHIVVVVPSIERNVYHVDNAMRLCGYFRSNTRVKYIKDRDGRNMEWSVIQYEAQFQSNCCGDELRQEGEPLIHLTPYYNITKIKANGLVPRCKNEMFKYPERIYFLKGSAPQQEIDLVGRVLYRTSANNPIHTGRHLPKGYSEGDYAIIYVDLGKVSDGVKFYPDPNMKNAVFTMENIPPTAIVRIEKRNYNY